MTDGLGGHRRLLVTASCALLAFAPKQMRAQQASPVVIDSIRGVPRVVNLPTSSAELSQFEFRKLWSVGGLDAPPQAQFTGPYFATALDQAGHAWILDHTAERLSLFDAKGSYLETVAVSGPGPAELSYPTGLSVGPKGQVWVEGALDGYYKVFASDGTFVRSVREAAHSINRMMSPFVVDSGAILEHARGYPTIKFFRLDTLATPIDSFSLAVPDIGTAGILRPGTAAFRVALLRPGVRWTMSKDGESIWIARSDSLGFTQLSVHGDTLRRVEARHRTGKFSASQRDDIRRAKHEMRNPGIFAPILIQAIYGLDGGRFLVQLGTDMEQPGRELDLYSPEGVLEGVIRPSIPVNHLSEMSSRGDTILYFGVGQYNVPVLVKAVLERRH